MTQFDPDERALPLTAPATEAGGLGADLYSKLPCGCERRYAIEDDTDDLFCIRCDNASVYKSLDNAMRERDTLRERVSGYADNLEQEGQEAIEQGERGYGLGLIGHACEIRLLLQPPAREGG